MKRVFPTLLALLAIGGVQLAATASPASACSLPAPTITANDAPANGVVLVDVVCGFPPCFEGELPETLDVRDAMTGEAVPGEIVRAAGDLSSGARLAWKPDAQLVAGRSYELMWRPESSVANEADSDFVFEALQAPAWTADDIALSDRLELLTEHTEYIECEELSPVLCGDGNDIDYAIPTEQRTSVALAVEVDPERMPEGSAGAYVLSAAFWIEGEDEPELEELSWYPAVDAWHTFEHAASGYCYRVQVTSLVDESSATHEGCVEHGELAQPATTAVADAEINTGLRQCKNAPEGYEARWCEARLAACEERDATRTDADCIEVAAMCEDESPMSDGGMGEPDAGEEPTEEDDGVVDEGCSVSGAQPDAGFLAWAIALLVWRRRRVRRGND